jgi:hypothetical protein
MAGVTSSQLHPIHHTPHLADIESRPAIFRSWERTRQRQAHWLVECIAEMVTLSLSSSVLTSPDPSPDRA